MKNKVSIFCTSLMLICLFLTAACLSSCSSEPSNSSGGGGNSSVSDFSGNVSKNLIVYYPIPQPLPQPPSPSSWFTFITDNGNITVTGFSQEYFSQFFMSNVISIPSAINGHPVVSIGYVAFADLTNITFVTIPDSVTNIGYMAFEDCPNLRYVTLGNKVSSISEFAFGDCSILTSVLSLNLNPPHVLFDTFRNCNKLLGIWVGGILIKSRYEANNAWGPYLQIGYWNLTSNISVLFFR